MAKFVIQPHGRLQEWIADAKGYFRDEGLDYEFRHGLSMESAKRLGDNGTVAEVRSGAFESYQRAGGNMGPPESPITTPEQLAGQEIAVGYHSGSHFTTLQALEAFLPPEEIKLKFVGSVWARVDVGVGRDVPATSVWGITYQVLEQFGFRRIVDTSFMIGFMFPNVVNEADVEKYMNGMRRAQMDLDIEPEKYKHYYLNELPERYKARLDVRRFSPGERVVFL